MSNKIKLAVGQRIRALRQKQALTQQELAELADIEYKYLQRIEGKNPPDMGIVLISKIAKALKTSPANLFK